MNTTDTSDKNKLNIINRESSSTGSQIHIPLDKEYAKQLSQAHGARAMARTKELIIY